MPSLALRVSNKRVSVGDVFRYVVFSALVLVAATFTGLVAVTANPLLIGLVVGVIGSGFLLSKPGFAVTLILFIGLTMGAILSFAGPAFSKLTWVVSMLSFFLFVPALLHVHRLKQAPVFIYVVMAFMLLALGTTLVHWDSTAEVIAGIKRGFQGFGLLFALVMLPFTGRDFARWRNLILFIVVLQLPLALYELLVLVPERGGLAVGSAVTDVIAGTFGANIEGGSPNAVMAILLLIALAFLFARWKEGLIKLRYLVIGVPICLAPIAMGEVKIAFLILPLMLLVIFRQEVIKRPVMFMGMVLFGTALMLTLGYILLEFIMRKSFYDAINETLSYNLYGTGYGAYALNRFSVLSFWWQQQGFHDPVGFVFGHGLGSSFSAEKTLVFGHLAAQWPRYGIDFTAASSLLWDTGVLGLALFMLMLLTAWHTCNQVKKKTRDRHITAEIAGIQAGLLAFAIFVFYSNDIVNYISLEIIMAFLLGYLAYLYRSTHVTSNQ